MNPLMIPTALITKRIKAVCIGLFVIIMSGIITVSYFKTISYIQSRENEIRLGAVAQCEAQHQEQYNKDVAQRLTEQAEEQKKRDQQAAAEKKLAVMRAAEAKNQERKHRQQLRRLQNVEESDCRSISAESVRLLNEQATEFNKRFVK